VQASFSLHGTIFFCSEFLTGFRFTVLKISTCLESQGINSENKSTAQNTRWLVGIKFILLSLTNELTTPPLMRLSP